MKVAIVSEFTADEAAIKILVDEIIGVETDLVASPRLRPRGWPSVLNLLPSILKHLHYNSDADGLVVVVDSDDSPLHTDSHDREKQKAEACRLCTLRNIIEWEKQKLTTIMGRSLLKTAIGVAVPTIEAWYHCGLDTHVNENTWGRKLLGERITYDRKSLKKSIYLTERASLSVMTQIACDAAQRLAADLDLLEAHFPIGFGCFVRDLQNW
jgi:hypothetical protein